ncbi:MAG: radical SAM protein [Clostridiaceae bacterium]|nr:radical SAM protein [Clostridiaceae bacterium]
MQSRNPYLLSLGRLEFSVTYACTSDCAHCSVGKIRNAEHIDRDTAVEAVREAVRYGTLESVMTFGGEPLLYAETVCAIHAEATRLGVGSRQIITNGVFSRDERRIRTVAAALADAGVNCVLLSVDAFHAACIPVDIQILFARALLDAGIQPRLHPAWLVSSLDDNLYNVETHRCLARFSVLRLPMTYGNIISPAGNAKTRLREYFPEQHPDMNFRCGDAQYTSRLDAVDCLSIDPNGDVIACAFPIGNLYRASLSEIITQYDPHANPLSHALLDGGITALQRFAESRGLVIDQETCTSACDLCHTIAEAYRKKGDVL